MSDDENDNIPLVPGGSAALKSYLYTPRSGRLKALNLFFDKAYYGRCAQYLLIPMTLILTVILVMFLSAQAVLIFKARNEELGQADWLAELPNTASECPIRLVEVNGDGIYDLIVGVLSNEQTSEDTVKDCSKFDRCYGKILAFSGEDGSLLWSISTKHEVFELRCPAVDVNNDGSIDCFASGRFGTLVAFDPVTGEVIWSNPKSVNDSWSVFAPALIPDIDNDDIQEIVVINGGDASYKPEDYDRAGNFLFVLSGRSGSLIGKKLPIPDGKESYSLPVVYDQSDGSKYIFFGSGGETISGGLHMVPLSDLLAFITPGVEYNLNGSYNYWLRRDKDANGVSTLYRTQTKGVMLPVSLVDLNQDGIEDIISVTHDGILYAISGHNLTDLWRPINFTIDISAESYTMPGFGYFNHDEVLDIMLSWHSGAYPSYDSQMIYIIDGSNGDLLWFKQTPSVAYTIIPILALSTSQPYRDAFIFSISSTNQNFIQVAKDNNSSVVDVSQHISSDYPNSDMSRRYRRHIEAHSSGSESCSDISQYFVDIMVMDRSVMKAPLRLYRHSSKKHFYRSGNKDTLRNNHFSNSHTSPALMKYGHHHGIGGKACSRMTPRDASAGVIADLNGNGKLDYIVMTSSVVAETHYKGSVPTTTSKTQSSILKFSLAELLPDLPQVHLNEVLVEFNSSVDEISLSNLALANMNSQLWAQLMGIEQSGLYSTHRIH